MQHDKSCVISHKSRLGTPMLEEKLLLITHAPQKKEQHALTSTSVCSSIRKSLSVIKYFEGHEEYVS